MVVKQAVKKETRKVNTENAVAASNCRFHGDRCGFCGHLRPQTPPRSPFYDVLCVYVPSKELQQLLLSNVKGFTIFFPK